MDIKGGSPPVRNTLVIEGAEKINKDKILGMLRILLLAVLFF